jgi:monovalent cation/hydrogen antiporter
LSKCRQLHAGLASFAHDQSPVAESVRRQLTARLANQSIANGADATHSEHDGIQREALRAAREAVLAMRAHHEIGDEAFHQIEEELD